MSLKYEPSSEPCRLVEVMESLWVNVIVLLAVLLDVTVLLSLVTVLHSIVSVLFSLVTVLLSIVTPL